MDNYKEKLKMNNLITAICCLILAAFCILAVVSEFVTPILPEPQGNSHWQSMWRGFISGVTCAILALMICSLIRNHRALRNEQALKKLYVKEHDERKAQIVRSAQAAGMQMFLLLGIVGVIIAGYFSMTVSMTILGCIVFGSWITVGFKIYYSKKY